MQHSDDSKLFHINVLSKQSLFTKHTRGDYRQVDGGVEGYTPLRTTPSGFLQRLVVRLVLPLE